MDKLGNVEKKDRKRFFRPIIGIDTIGMKIGIIMIISVFIAAILGIIITNYIIMPKMIGYGNEISVPDITGLNIYDAKVELKKHNLHIQIDREIYSEAIEQNTIISQTPLPNTTIKFNKTIIVVLSKGTEKIIVPGVRTLFINDAVELLNENGFIVRDTVYTFSIDIPSNCAINTHPPLNVITTKGSFITLYVSRGKKKDYVQMPSFIAMMPDSAKWLAKNLKLIIGEMNEQPGIYDRPAVIIQSPDSGIWIRRGDTIILTVGIPYDGNNE